MAFRNKQHLLCALSPKQKEVVRLIAKEFNNIEIAGLLNISEKTVEAHRRNIKNNLKLCEDKTLKCLCCEIALWLNELGGDW